MNLNPAATEQAFCLLCPPETPQAEEAFLLEGWRLVRCAGCGLVFLNPRPPAEWVFGRYTFAEGYGLKPASDPAVRAEFKLRSQKHLRLLQQFKTGGQLLDVGCSTGILLAEAKALRWEPVGVDVSPDTSEIARHATGCSVHTGPLESAAFPDDSFDAVVMGDLIEHTWNPLETMKEVRRILRPGGVVLLATPDNDSSESRITHKLLAKRLHRWPYVFPPLHLFEFSRRTLRLLLEKADFKVERIVSSHVSLRWTFPPYRSVKTLGIYAVMTLSHLAARLTGRGIFLRAVARNPEAP